MNGTRTISKRRGLSLIKPAALGVAVLLLSGVLAGCSPSNDEPATDNAAPRDTLNIAIGSAPKSLDPAAGSNDYESQLFAALAYEPLINVSGDMKMTPGLALSWDYIGDDLTQLRLKLRPDVTFSDGSPVDAAAVAESLKHHQTAGGAGATYAKQIADVEVESADSLIVKFTTPNPSAAYFLTSRFMIGNVVGPAGIKDPSSFGLNTDGAGQYVIDPAQTVAGSNYAFVKNPNYYAPDDIHFDKVNVRVIESPETRLSAVDTGQVDFATGTVTNAEGAEKSGLKVYSATAAFNAIFLFDRDGAIVPALAKQEVRQALNYATNRTAITTAVFGSLGVPNDQPVVEGYSGYSADYADRYPYDEKKAKKLLADAGYPDGFEMTVGATAGWGDGLQLAQAIASDWGKIGVKVNIDTYPNLQALLAPWGEKKIPAVAGINDGKPVHLAAGQLLLPTAGLFNPFESADPELAKAITAAQNAGSEKDAEDAWQKVTEKVVDLGWLVPIASSPYVYFADASLSGFDGLSSTAFVPNPTLLSFTK